MEKQTYTHKHRLHTLLLIYILISPNINKFLLFHYNLKGVYFIFILTNLCLYFSEKTIFCFSVELTLIGNTSSIYVKSHFKNAIIKWKCLLDKSYTDTEE